MIRLRDLIYGNGSGLTIRKWTTPVHWFLGGLFAAVSTFLYFPAGFALLVLAALNQIWNDREEGLKDSDYVYCGCTDWWESWIVYLGFIATVTFPLNIAGIISTRMI